MIDFTALEIHLTPADRAQLQVMGPYTGDMGAAMDVLQPDKVIASTYEMIDSSLARVKLSNPTRGARGTCCACMLYACPAGGSR